MCKEPGAMEIGRQVEFTKAVVKEVKEEKAGKGTGQRLPLPQFTKRFKAGPI